MLRLEALERRFGAITAVAQLNLDVPAGARLGLIGPNGSGKTTVLNLISGIDAPNTGRIWFDGARIDGHAPHTIARRGVARTFQNLRLAGRMSVFENVWIAQYSQPGAAMLRIGTDEERRRRAAIDALLEKVGLARDRDKIAADLPLPQQRRLELARALARTPRVLLLDEPAGGMTPAETKSMAALIGRLVPRDTALILVEHKLGLVMELCARVAVLDFGRKIAEGPPGEVLRDRRVAEVYLGRAAVPLRA